MAYKAILFDAGETLWQWPADPVVILQEVLRGSGIAVDGEQLRYWHAQVESACSLRWHSFESNGRGATEADLRSYFNDINRELLKGLGIPDPTDVIAAAIQRAFASQRPSLLAETLAVLEGLHTRGFKLTIVYNGWRQASERSQRPLKRQYTSGTATQMLWMGLGEPRSIPCLRIDMAPLTRLACPQSAPWPN